VENERGSKRSLAVSMRIAKARFIHFFRIVGCALVLAVGAIPGCASGADADSGRIAMPPELARAIAAYDQATIDKDIVRLAALVKDDYVLVNSDMSVQRKPSYLEDFKVAGFRIDQYHLSEPILIVHADSALTGGYFQLSWTQDGRHWERRTRIVHFWEKDAGVWRLAYTQLTRAVENR
jgi:ketosteroid isomerase-like protein